MPDKKTSKSPERQPDQFYNKQRLGSHLLLVLILAFLVGTFMIIKPYIHAIILAGIFAMLFYPVHQFIRKRLKNRENLAAFCSSTLVALLVIGPDKLPETVRAPFGSAKSIPH